MPLQNRVLPTGEIIATPVRGTMTGNRGILHGSNRTLGASRWTHKAWICCVLDWHGRRREVMTGRNWTELFFLDEAVALAAGHRPCGYCRRKDYQLFQNAWQIAQGPKQRAPQMDAALHKARVRRDRSQVTFRAELDRLPPGTFVELDGQPCLIWETQLWPYHPGGYGTAMPIPQTPRVTVLTPAPMVAVLTAGYRPKVTGLAANH